MAREANVPYQLAFDALNALVVAYEDEHAAEALRVRLRKYESGTTPMTDAPMLNALLAIISSYRVAACLSIPEQLPRYVDDPQHKDSDLRKSPSQKSVAVEKKT